MKNSVKVSQPKLPLAEFQQHLDRYGDDWSAWPADLQTRAKHLVAHSPKAATLMEKARALGAALRSGPKKAPAGLADRIVAAATKASPPKSAKAKPKRSS